MNRLRIPNLKCVVGVVLILLAFGVSCRRKELPSPVMPRPKALPKLAPQPPPVEKPVPIHLRAKGPVRIAIIIDDFGYSDDVARPFIQLPFPIAISVLPRLRYSEWTAREARKAGKPVLLHLPVEAIRGNESLGPGAILTNMNGREIQDTFAADLATVPQAQGVNNHMGSKGTSDPRVAELIAAGAQAHNLFVIDSETSSNSLLYHDARKLNLPAAYRDVFLDNTSDEKAIASRIDELVATAREKGEAIAIGHPRPGTLKVLLERIPKLDPKEVDVVPVTELLKK